MVVLVADLLQQFTHPRHNSTQTQSPFVNTAKAGTGV